MNNNALIPSGWKSHRNCNAVKGLVDSPSQADEIDTFDLGIVARYRHGECERRCEAKPGCVAYSQFPM